ncbi:MAG: hypothetical protein ACTHZ9_00460 [Leucobacter sp.]
MTLDLVIAQILLSQQPVLANSGFSVGEGILLAGPIAAGLTFWFFYRKYRNVDKKFRFESEARVEAQPATGTDVRIGENRGSSQPEIAGRNSDHPRLRVRRMQ